MQHTVGRWLVGLAGLIIVICGLALIVEGVRRKFMKFLRTAQMSARMRRVVELFGMTGTIARGLVFALVGALAAGRAGSGGGSAAAVLAVGVGYLVSQRGKMVPSVRVADLRMLAAAGKRC